MNVVAPKEEQPSQVVDCCDILAQLEPYADLVPGVSDVVTALRKNPSIELMELWRLLHASIEAADRRRLWALMGAAGPMPIADRTARRLN
jgi:hypothetical protein